MSGRLPIDRVRENDAQRICTLERQLFAKRRARLREKARRHGSQDAANATQRANRGASDGAPGDA
jgi:hypothetical protein